MVSFLTRDIHILYPLESGYESPYSFAAAYVYFSPADQTLTLTSNTRQIYCIPSEETSSFGKEPGTKWYYRSKGQSEQS